MCKSFAGLYKTIFKPLNMWIVFVLHIFFEHRKVRICVLVLVVSSPAYGAFVPSQGSVVERGRLTLQVFTVHLYIRYLVIRTELTGYSRYLVSQTEGTECSLGTWSSEQSSQGTLGT